MAVSLVGIYSGESVWLVRKVRRVLRLPGVGSKTKNWVDCNTEESKPGGNESESATIGKEYDSDGKESESAADSKGRELVTFDSPSDEEH